MARALRYHPLFDCDVREAAGWYDRRSAGLGDVFVDLVSESVAEITGYSTTSRHGFFASVTAPAGAPSHMPRGDSPC